jgi:5'(3')-deoxyribonucleotidase
MNVIKVNRNYSIINVSDENHTNNGRCPNYALTWPHNENMHHWPIGHDYFIGNGQNIDDETKELREILSNRLSTGKLTKSIVFCDLDGVLADFEQGVLNKFNKYPDQINTSFMWSIINKSKTFFEMLPWMPKGRELWSHIKEYNPIILTGIPRGNNSAVEQKIRWCQRELGSDIQVITCSTREKVKYCLPGSILIDDRTDNFDKWHNKGGKFILYDETYLDDIIERINRHMEEILPSP